MSIITKPNTNWSMREVNKIIQLIFITALVLLTFSLLFDQSLVMVILLLGLPLGFSQFLYGILDVLAYKEDSPYRRYLYASAITLGLIAFACYDGRVISEPLRDLLISAVSISCVVLAIYFWFITFRLSEIVKRNHNVLDLE